MNPTETAGRAGAQRIQARLRFSLYELVSAVNEIAESEEEAVEIVMDVLETEGLRLSKAVPGRPLHRF
jgi:hypothetical protein